MHATTPPSPLPSSNGHLPGTEGYEKYLVHSAQELVREIARLFEKDRDSKEKPNAKFNANRAWESLNALGRIEL